MKQDNSKKPKAEKRNRVVVTKVTTKEFYKMKILAKRCDMSVSSYIRARSLGYEPKERLSSDEVKSLKNLADCRIDMVNFANALSGLTDLEKLALFRNHKMMFQWYELVASITDAVTEYLQSVQKSNDCSSRSTPKQE